MANARTIGTLYDCETRLWVKKENDRFWWIICEWTPDTEYWEEIPEYLYAALNRFEDEEQSYG